MTACLPKGWIIRLAAISLLTIINMKRYYRDSRSPSVGRTSAFAPAAKNLPQQFLVVIGNAKFENEGVVFMQRSLLDVLNRVK